MYVCIIHGEKGICLQCFENALKKQSEYYMNTAPQAITQRYISNLVTNGRNKEFDVAYVARLYHKVDGHNVGIYFSARVDNTKGDGQEAPGATISQAVRRALEGHGVTFR